MDVVETLTKIAALFGNLGVGTAMLESTQLYETCEESLGTKIRKDDNGNILITEGLITRCNLTICKDKQ